jgi:hypothetical protein
VPADEGVEVPAEEVVEGVHVAEEVDGDVEVEDRYPVGRQTCVGTGRFGLDCCRPHTPGVGVLGGPPVRQWAPSQREDQVADGGRLGEEGVVAGVEFHDAARPTGELALQLGGGALVLCADEVRRGHALPGR